MIDRGNGQAQSAKVNPTQKQFFLNRAASKSKCLSVIGASSFGKR
jgi:protein involved in ribonucleotide reduction